MPKFPPEWLEKIPAEVFYSPRLGELRIILFPGNGFVNGGALRDISVQLVPWGLRMPNTRLWAQLDDAMEVVHVWRRDE